MPFLRFTRDKRGYETTSLVHAVRRGGRSRQRLLYWFRTPPGVKVGRPALDQEAIRWIEEHNPDIEFDWQKILEAQPPAEAPVEDARNRRGRRDRPERPRQPRAPSGPQEPAAQPAPEPEAAPVEEHEAEIDDEAEAEPLPEEELVEAIEQLTHPEAEEKIEPLPMPAEESLGTEQLTRLRARFAELQTRITERGGDLERIEALRAQAESLNPDTWVTQEEVRQGIETFEPKIRDLRAALGLRRRRRSRRGGHRRRSGGGGAPPTETPPESSE